MFDKIFHKFKDDKLFYILLASLIILGIFLRLYIYLQQYSLEGDECSIAYSIINRQNLTELIFAPFYSYNQAAPAGFLAVTKIITNIFGINELTLRFFPFISGILSIFLFYNFAKNYLTSKSLLLSIFLFSVSGSLISYSATYKPYSVDVMAALIVFNLAEYFFNREKINIYTPAIIGAVLVWFSYPVCILLVSVGIYYLFIYITKKQKTNFLNLSVIGYTWFFSLLNASMFAYYNLNWSKKYFLAYWKDSFIPFPPDWKGFVYSLKELSSITFENAHLLMCILIITGAGLCIFQRKEKSVLLFLPILITMALSSIKAYPFGNRLILFLSPIVIIFVSKNLEYFSKKIIITVLVLTILFQIPFSEKNYMHLRTNIKVNDFFTFIEQNAQKTDYIFSNYNDSGYFRYYKYKYHIPENYYIKNYESFKNPDNLDKSIGFLKTKTKRFWIPIFITYNNNDPAIKKQIDYLKNYLKSHKNLKLVKFKKDEKKGGEIYLYEFAQNL